MTAKTEVFSAKVPVGLKRRVDMVCEELGLRKGRVVEEALREKLEDLMDAHDLREAIPIRDAGAGSTRHEGPRALGRVNRSERVGKPVPDTGCFTAWSALVR